MIVLAFNVKSQEYKIDTNNKGLLTLDADVYCFYKDNEYIGYTAYGYTLPGVRLNPSISFQATKNLKFSVGFSALKYWGANVYPAYNYVSVPKYSNDKTQKDFHYMPTFSVNWQINKNLNFIMGNIYHYSYHLLNEPLFNRELEYTEDNEEGLQLLYNGKFFKSDVWLNWQNFNFYDDVDREQFLFGFSSKIIPIDKTFGFDIPLSFMWQHHGGELDTIDAPLDHWSNGNVGLDLFYKPNTKYLNKITASINYYFSKDLKNNTWRFKSGYAFCPSIRLENKNNDLTFGYYSSEKMISFYGSAFFSNLAQRDTNIIYPKNNVFFLSYYYNMNLGKNYDISFQTEWFYKEKTTINKIDVKETERAKISFSFGVVLKAKPKIKLNRVNNLEYE